MALTTNLLHYYKFDSDNSNDSVGSLNGTDTSITYGATQGKINHGAGGNGTTSKIAITSSDFETGTGDFSISLWANRQGNGTSGSSGAPVFIVDNTSSGSVTAHIFLIWDTDGIIYCRFYDGTNGAQASYNPGSVNNSWHHIVFTRTSGTATIYYDGSSVATASNTFGTSANSNLTDTQYGLILGDRGGGGGGFFNGYTDEIGFWSRALSSGEVTSLYNGGAGFQYPFTVASPAKATFLLKMI